MTPMATYSCPTMYRTGSIFRWGIYSTRSTTTYTYWSDAYSLVLVSPYPFVGNSMLYIDGTRHPVWWIYLLFMRNTSILENYIKHNLFSYTGPRPPHLSQHPAVVRQYVNAVGQQNGATIPVNVAHLPPDDRSVHSNSVNSNSSGHLRESSGTALDKMVLDSHQHSVVVSSDPSSTGTSTWISNHGQLVTVWTPTLVSPTARSICSINRINNAKKQEQINRNSSDLSYGSVAQLSRDQQYHTVAETQTWIRITINILSYFKSTNILLSAVLDLFIEII